jgi:Caspase domain
LNAASFSSGSTLTVPVGESVIEPFNMKHTNRGRILIIFNSDFGGLKLPPRNGFKRDIEVVLDTFGREMGFEADVKENLTGFEMFHAVQKGIKVSTVCESD